MTKIRWLKAYFYIDCVFVAKAACFLMRGIYHAFFYRPKKCVRQSVSFIIWKKFPKFLKYISDTESLHNAKRADGDQPVLFFFALKSALRVIAVVGSFFGDINIVRVAFFKTRACNSYEFTVFL